MRCNGQKIRFVNKNTNENERKTFASWWSEATQLFGTSISYFVHGYSLTTHDAIYGEQPTATFSAPVTMLALAQMNNDSLLLSKFGIQADAELTLVIPIKDFAEYMGNPTATPKAGDLIMLSELGWDRPGGGGYPNSYPTSQLSAISSVDVCSLSNPESIQSFSNNFISGSYVPWENWIRGPNVYEITERRDENIPGMINPLMAHIIWYIKCKRFDYSGEPSAPREHGFNIVSDNTRYGKISGTPTIEPIKQYIQTGETEAQKSWDYTKTHDEEYGGFGRNTEIIP